MNDPHYAKALSGRGYTEEMYQRWLASLCGTRQPPKPKGPRSHYALLAAHRQRKIRRFGFFAFPGELRDAVYDEVLLKGRQQIADLPIRCHTFPTNNNETDHVPFIHKSNYLKEFLASNKRLRDECEARMYGTFHFRVLVRLSFKCPTHLDHLRTQLTPENIIPRTWVTPPCRIGPQLPSPSVWQCIKHLRLEILLDGNPDVKLGYPGVLRDLRHLYLKIMWPKLKKTHMIGQWLASVYWTQKDIDRELNDLRWAKFFSDLLSFVLSGVHIHVLDGSGWTKAREGVDAVVVDSMPERINRLLKAQGWEVSQ